MSGWRRPGALALVLTLAMALVGLSAYERALGFDWREVAVMSPEAQIDLALPHLAHGGEWVARDRPSARGPLWQAALAALTPGSRAQPARVAVTRAVVFPLFAIALVALLAVRSSRRPRVRSGVAFATLAWVLLDPEEAPWRLSVIVGLLLIYPRDEGRTERATRRGVWAAMPVALVGGFAPAVLIEGALAFGVASIVATTFVGVRVAMGRLAGAALTLAGACAVLVSFAWPDPLLPWATLAWPQSVALEAWSLSALALSLAAAAAWVRAREVIWLAGTIPLSTMAALSGDLHGVAPPIAVSVLLLTVSLARRHRILALAGALVVTVALLGHGGEQRPAWHPARLSRALSFAEPPAGGGSDDARVRDALLGRRGCVVAPADLAVAWASAGARGPLEAPLDRDGWARQIRLRRCPWAVVVLPTVDGDGSLAAGGFDLAGMALSELYRPVVQLGPGVFLAERGAPREPRRRALPISPPAPREAELRAGESLRFDLARSVPADHLLELALELTPVGAPSGMPELVALRGDEPVRGALSLPLPDASGRVRVPVEGEIADHRWRLGRPVSSPPEADAFVLRYRGEGAWSVRVSGALELAPAPPLERAPTPAPSLPLDLAVQPSWPRHTATTRDGPDLVLTTNPASAPDAELFIGVAPPPGACLVGEVGLEASSSAARFQIHVIDGPARPRRVDWTIDRGWRRPFVLALPAHPVIVRFGVSSNVAGARIRLHRPRLVSCGARRALVHALQDGQHSVVRGTPSVTGDTLTLPARPRGQAPVEVRLTHVPRPGDCLSVELRGRSALGTVAVGVGVVHRGRLHRLAREVFWPDDQRPQRAFRDLPLGEWVGQEVALRFAAWPMERETRGGVGEIVRPQIHACGERPTWHF